MDAQTGQPARKPAAGRIACSTEQHSRSQTLVLIPGRPINNRPQADSLPHNSLQAAKILKSSSTEQLDSQPGQAD
jgi:hypothetical protein